MKNLYLFIVIIIVIISFVKCGSNNEEKDEKKNKNDVVNQNDSSGIISSTPYEVKGDESFHLAYKFKIGKSFKYRLTTISSTKQSITSDSTINNNFDQKVTRILTFNTISMDRDTIANLRCTVTDIDVNRNIDGKTLNYKSGEDLDSTKLNNFGEYAVLINNPFNLKVTTHGKIIEIYGVGKIVDKLVQMTKMNKSMNNEQKENFINRLKENFLKPMLNQFFRELPDKELKIGGNWTNSIPPATVMAFKLSYNNIFSLDNIEKVKNEKIAVIAGKSNISVEGKTKQVNRGVEYNFEKPTVSAGGKLFFNMDKGLLYKSDTGTNLEINYKYQMIGPNGLVKASTKRKVTNKSIAELL